MGFPLAAYKPHTPGGPQVARTREEWPGPALLPGSRTGSAGEPARCAHGPPRTGSAGTHFQAVQLLGCEGCARPLGPVQVQALGQNDFPDGPFGICGSREGSQVSSPAGELAR